MPIVRNGLVAANSQKPMGETVVRKSDQNQAGASINMAPRHPTVSQVSGDFVKDEVDNHLHKHHTDVRCDVAEDQESRKERVRLY